MSITPKLNISSASLSDVKDMATLEALAYPLPWSSENLQNIVQQQGNECGQYIVQKLYSKSVPNNVLYGYFLALLGYQDIHLLNLAIHPKYQHQGFAHLMLQHLQRCAIRYNAHSIWLEVRQSNQRAQQIYRRFGFTDISTRADYYPKVDGSREDALVMKYTVRG